jgi:hypothetical protein
MTIQASTAVATANSPAPVKTAQTKINAALATPGATGMKGFLIWVKAAWPKKISDPIIKAAAAHLAATQAAGAASPAGSLGAYQKAAVGLVPYPRRGMVRGRPSQATIARRAGIAGMGGAPGMGRYSGRTTFGVWGDVATAQTLARRAGMGRLGATGNTGALTTPIGSTGSTATVASTPSSAASTNWAQTISGAVNSAVGAYVGVTQAQDAQTLFNTNLVRAQQGLAPIGANPSAVGIIPTAETTLDLGPILLIGAAIAALAIIAK